MLFDNLPLPLPWYPKVIMQDRFRQNVAVNNKICQLAPYNGLLPFQVRKPKTSEIPRKWYIRCVSDASIDEHIEGFEDAVVVDLSAYITVALEWLTLDDMDVFLFKNSANNVLPSFDLPPGRYYMEFQFLQTPAGTDLLMHYASEVFRVPDDKFEWSIPENCNYPCLKWYHNSDLQPIHYPGDGSFFSLLYLDTFITASEPEIDIIAEKDGVEELHPTFQKAVIKYRISALVPDFLKVAIFLMQMHDQQLLTTERGLRSGALKNVDISASITSDGAYSVVEILFEQMQLIIDTGCTNDMDPPEPYIGGGGQTIDAEYCSSSGAVIIQVIGPIEAGVYGELWGKIGAGPYIKYVNYIARQDLLDGKAVSIPGGLGVTKFKVVLRTFTFTTGETAEGAPVASC